MKIVHFLSTLDVGGAESVVVNTLIELKKRGHNVSLIVIYGTNTVLKDKLISNDIQIYELLDVEKKQIFNEKKTNKIEKLLESYLYELFVRIKLHKLIHSIKFDVFHSHLETCKYLNNCKYGRWIYTCHSDFERYKRIYGNNWYRTIRKLSKYGMTIIGLNPEMVKEIKSEIPFADVKFLPNGIYLSECEKKMDKKDLCESLHISEESYLICQVGRLEPVKNYEKSIDIINKMIKKYGKKYVLLIVGSGDSKYEYELKKRCTYYGITSNVKFLGFRNDVSEIISAVDVCVLPSKNEGFSITALEYQLHGKKSVFSTAIPLSVVCNSNCKRLDIKDNDEKWIEAILGDEEFKYESNIKMFDWSNIIDELIKIYRKR